MANKNIEVEHDLLSTADVGRELESNKQWVHWALENRDDFPKPYARISKYIGWKQEDIEQFKEKLFEERKEKQLAAAEKSEKKEK